MSQSVFIFAISTNPDETQASVTSLMIQSATNKHIFISEKKKTVKQHKQICIMVGNNEYK